MYAVQNSKSRKGGAKWEKSLSPFIPVSSLPSPLSRSNNASVSKITCVCSLCCCCWVTQLCLTLCDPMDCSTPDFPVLHNLPEFAQTRVLSHWCHPTISSSSPAFNLSQHQGLFQWVGSSHKVAKVKELQLQHQSFQWIFRVDFL